MSDPSEYGLLAAQAEKAVKSVKEPALRRIAFQKILDELLSSKSNTQTKALNKRPSSDGNAFRTPKRGGPNAYIRQLSNDHFFKTPKTIAQVKAELENRGHHIPLTSLSGPLQKLCQNRVLRRQKRKGEKDKVVFTYTDW